MSNSPQRLNILIASSEVVPFAKSGGLADVVGVLPKALAQLGHDIRVVMPRYYCVDKEKYQLKKLQPTLPIFMGKRGFIEATIYEGVLPNSSVPIYFIDYEPFFGRIGLYDHKGKGYQDNDSRFIFFSKAVMELAKMLQFKPHVIHTNDWHTAPIPVLLNSTYHLDPHFAYTGTLLTLHNLQYQGIFHKSAMESLGVGWEHFNADELEAYGSVNLLKGGIVHADAINAVSQQYAKEICTPDFGWGLDRLILHHKNKLFGILNGVDYEEWSPAIDSHIPAPFDSDNLEGKLICKRALQKQFHLPQCDDVPLIGLVGRLAEQKGIVLLSQTMQRLLEFDIQIVLLGTGEPWAESFFGDIASRYSDKFACYIGYRNDLSHLIEAGSDIFLMPSLFEPCGLNQIYSLRYGTVPIVRATGGLDDTIDNYDKERQSGTGFKFYDATPQALIGTVKWAVDTWYHDKQGFAMLRDNGMKKRFNWEESAKHYEALYYHIVNGRHS